MTDEWKYYIVLSQWQAEGFSFHGTIIYENNPLCLPANRTILVVVIWDVSQLEWTIQDYVCSVGLSDTESWEQDWLITSLLPYHLQVII